jgi:hypothetical protein
MTEPDHPADARPRCALSINVARTDVPYLATIVTHLVRACAFPFVERTLVVDAAPPHRRYASSEVASLDRLRAICRELEGARAVDRIVEVDDSPALRRRIMHKHYGRALRERRDYRGYPTYGVLYAYEIAAGDYFLHFDADMLLHQDPGFSWIDEAIGLLRRRTDVAVVAPLAGPPTTDGTLRQRVPHARDHDGFHRFTHFTSRKFLVDRARFDSLLPLAPEWVSTRRRITAFLRGRSALERWEKAVSDRLAALGRYRADLASPRAWTLHPPDHGAAFVAALPSIIARVEAGEFPAEQAGDYDLRLDLWR